MNLDSIDTFADTEDTFWKDAAPRDERHVPSTDQDQQYEEQAMRTSLFDARGTEPILKPPGTWAPPFPSYSMLKQTSSRLYYTKSPSRRD